jgi:hypothetical protein
VVAGEVGVEVAAGRRSFLVCVLLVCLLGKFILTKRIKKRKVR